MSPNEVRFRFYDLGPVEGGESPYLQQQNWPLRLLADRELPSLQPQSAAQLPPAPEPDEDEDNKDWHSVSLKVQEKLLALRS